jgi:exosortase/archaeosortase
MSLTPKNKARISFALDVANIGAWSLAYAAVTVALGQYIMKTDLILGAITFALILPTLVLAKMMCTQSLNEALHHLFW